MRSSLVIPRILATANTTDRLRAAIDAIVLAFEGEEVAA